MMAVRSTLLLVLLLAASPSRAVLFASTGDPTFNTMAPEGAYQDSGWQFEGQWLEFLGTPIGPQQFITSRHVGGTIGDLFFFRGETYVTDGVVNAPVADLSIWHVTTAFPDYALLYRHDDEVGKELVVIGRGTQRGTEILIDQVPAGWEWGPGDEVQRWGTNVVSGIVTDAPDEGVLLSADFDLGVSENEADISVGDSGGGVFIRDVDDVWKLAGINDSVDGYYATDASGTLLANGSFSGLGALYDRSGLFLSDLQSPWIPVNGPGLWYANRIFSNLEFIDSVVTAPEPESGAGLAAIAALAAIGRLRSRPLGRSR